jgi:hypothetical protein
MSRVVGLLSWYDEAPSWLAATVASFAPYIDALVAVDGPYAAFPHNGRAKSSPEQVEAIQRVADAVGIELIIHQPSYPWLGGEVEKRTQAFHLCQSITDDQDWIWVFDADEVLTKAPSDFRLQLEDAPSDAVAATLTQTRNLDELGDVAGAMSFQPDSHHDLTMIFRALDGLRVMGRHDTYVAGTDENPVYLWGPSTLPVVTPWRMVGLEVEHRTHRRAAVRKAQSAEYYRTRDALGLERLGVRVMETEDGSIKAVR